MEEVLATAVPKETEYAVVETLGVFEPLFNAYDYSLAGPVFNVERAKEIQRNRWREARKPMLEALDVEFMRAWENQSTEQLSGIASSKQVLRDITQREFPESSPEGIWGYWPAPLIEPL